MKKKLIAALIVVAVLVVAVGALFWMVRREGQAREIALETAQEMADGILADALSNVSPSSAQYLADHVKITVKDMEYGTAKNIILTCDIGTLDVYGAVMENSAALLSISSQDAQGREMVSTQIKAAVNERLLPLLEQAKPITVTDFSIRIYDTHEGLRVYTSDEVMDTVTGGAVRLAQELRGWNSFTDETGESRTLSTNVRNAVLSCIELRYDTAQPVTQGPLVKRIEKFKADFRLNFIEDNRWMYMVRGLRTTLLVTLYALLLGIAMGVAVAAVRSTHDKTVETTHGLGRVLLVVFDRICRIYLTVIRGTPVVVQLMLIYYVILASSTNKIFVASLAFGINSGAYVAEIIRSGIMSVDHGQFEAGRSLGFSYLRTMQYIVIPQALRNVLPSLANEFIVLLKETSVAGYVALQDLTKAGDIIRSRTYSAFMPLLAVALIYLVLVIFFTWLVGKLERRLRRSER